MGTASISITACDNELYLLAVPAVSSPSASYQIAHIQSGNTNAVGVTVTVSAGTYSEQLTLNGVNSSLQGVTQSVSIPTGTYSVVAIGIDWGVIQGYAFSINGGTPYSYTDNTPQSLSVGWTQVVTSAFSVS